MRTSIAFLFLLAACGPASAPVFTLDPPLASAFGHQPITARGDFSALREPLTVSVAGVSAYDIRKLDDHAVQFTPQGSPLAGPVPVVIASRDAALRGPLLVIAPPVDARFERMVGFGASLTMGAQDASISMRSQLHGPAAQLARAAGAYLPLPLVKDGYMPTITAADFDKQTCAFTAGSDIMSVVGSRVGSTLLAQISDRSGVPHLDRARIDPSLEARNVAIAGMRIGSVVSGADDLGNIVLEHLVWDPFGDLDALLAKPRQTQLDRVVALKPTLLMTTDIFGNDYDNVNLAAPGIPDLSALTPIEDFDASLDAVLARLDDSGAEIFMGTGPDVTVLPAYAAKVASLRAAGYSDADSTAWLDAIRARIDAFNARLRAVAAQHPRLHVVDVHAEVADIFTNGVDVAGEHLSARPFGGLLSLDAMHFSDTGYALLAQRYADAMHDDLGISVPPIDLAAVRDSDPYSVASLRAQGFACAGQ